MVFDAFSTIGSVTQVNRACASLPPYQCHLRSQLVSQDRLSSCLLLHIFLSLCLPLHILLSLSLSLSLFTSSSPSPHSHPYSLFPLLMFFPGRFLGLGVHASPAESGGSAESGGRQAGYVRTVMICRTYCTCFMT